MTEAPVKRLHWGCGRSAVSGWINSDRKAGAGIDCVADICAAPLPLESDSIDYAVSIHALQEIPMDRQVAVLAELRRVLKPGGVLRLCLPDLNKGIAAYLGKKPEHFLVPDQDASSLGGKFITHMLWYGHSRVLFTDDFVEELLKRAGFASVQHCECGQTYSPHAAITSLDNRAHESLFIEAFK
jgi:predicted SAM-dependent methyltransferase